MDAEHTRKSTPSRSRSKAIGRGALRINKATPSSKKTAVSKSALWNRIQASNITLAVAAIAVFICLWLGSHSMKLAALHEEWASQLDSHLDASELALASQLSPPSVYSQNSAEGLRLIGTQTLLKWRLKNAQHGPIEDIKSMEWKLTSPFITRLSATEFNRKNRDVRLLFGSEDQIKLWNEGRLCFRLGHALSPLEWRLMCGQMLLDWTTPELWQRKYLYRCAAMAQQRVPELFEVAMLAETLGEVDLATNASGRLL